MNVNQPRAEALAALAEIADIAPQMRAGQIMAAVGEICADLHGRGLWDAEDGELLEAIWKFRRDLESAASGHAAASNEIAKIS